MTHYAQRSVDDGREAVGPLIAVPREAVDARAITAHHQPVAVMLDFVNPEQAGRWPGRPRRQAQLDEAGGTPDHDRECGGQTGFTASSDARAFVPRAAALVGSVTSKRAPP